jgi:hypothetical protein
VKSLHFLKIKNINVSRRPSSRIYECCYWCCLCFLSSKQGGSGCQTVWFIWYLFSLCFEWLFDVWSHCFASNSEAFRDLYSENDAKTFLVSGNVSTGKFFLCWEEFVKLLQTENQDLMNSSELIYSSIPTLSRNESRWNILAFTHTASTAFCIFRALTNFSDSRSFFSRQNWVLFKPTYVPILKVNRRAIGIHSCVLIPFCEIRHFNVASGRIFSEKITHFVIAFHLHGNQFLTGLHERKQRLIIGFWQSLQSEDLLRTGLTTLVTNQGLVTFIFWNFAFVEICHVWKNTISFNNLALILYLCFQLFKHSINNNTNDNLDPKKERTTQNILLIGANRFTSLYRSIATWKTFQQKYQFFSISKNLNSKYSSSFFWRHRFDMRWKQINIKIRIHSATVCREDHL